MGRFEFCGGDVGRESLWLSRLHRAVHSTAKVPTNGCARSHTEKDSKPTVLNSWRRDVSQANPEWTPFSCSLTPIFKQFDPRPASCLSCWPSLKIFNARQSHYLYLRIHKAPSLRTPKAFWRMTLLDFNIKAHWNSSKGGALVTGQCLGSGGYPHHVFSRDRPELWPWGLQPLRNFHSNPFYILWYFVWIWFN